MIKFQCQWDYSSNVCNFNSDSEGVLQGYSITSVGDSVTPAHKENVIQTTLVGNDKFCDVILWPLKTFVVNHGLTVVRELVKSTFGENFIDVGLFNQYDLM